ncbi:hypothetical protein GCM10027423_35260 [Spirosoma arcticum]
MDKEEDETLLEAVNRILARNTESDILDDLTEEQLLGIEQAREEARQGKGMPLADFKRKMETKWPQLKSL